jgi:hypothetical protein
LSSNPSATKEKKRKENMLKEHEVKKMKGYIKGKESKFGKTLQGLCCSHLSKQKEVLYWQSKLLERL